MFLFYETSLSSSLVHIKLGTWLDSETLYLEWGFLFDSITTTMLVVVTFVSY
jgi:NADH:ubiquinone oxidoreductase subunit 5 (subunit L)/multisubunit Na+/H+ antiporter MnhA subunit